MKYILLIGALLLTGCASKPKVMKNCSDVPQREAVFVCDDLE